MKYLRVAGCFLQYDGSFLLLLRHAHKPDGDTWGLPGGKVESNESDIDTIKRELKEETGYDARDTELIPLGTYLFYPPHHDFALQYVTYKLKLRNAHVVELEDAAHKEYRWFTAKEALALPNLIFGLEELLEKVGYKI